MPGFRHILFPVDFSDRCATVRPFVRQLAHRSNAKITLLHTFEQAQGLCGASEGAFAATFDVEQMHEESCALLAKFFPSEPGDHFEIVKSAARGDPDQAIVAFARKNDVDLIMLPTHGHGMFHRLLLGSVTSKILDSAPCAVWAAAHTEDPALPTHAACRTIIVAVTGAADEVQTIRRAAEICEKFEAKPLLLHALKDRSGVESARAGIDTLQRTAQTNLEVAVEAGDCIEVVGRFARQKNADLLILGRGNWRTKCQEIIRNARCPVLSL